MSSARPEIFGEVEEPRGIEKSRRLVSCCFSTKKSANYICTSHIIAYACPYNRAICTSSYFHHMPGQRVYVRKPFPTRRTQRSHRRVSVVVLENSKSGEGHRWQWFQGSIHPVFLISRQQIYTPFPPYSTPGLRFNRHRWRVRGVPSHVKLWEEPRAMEERELQGAVATL